MSDSDHLKRIEELQNQIKGSCGAMALNYGSKQQANVARSKQYKKGVGRLNLEGFRNIIDIDRKEKIAIVEPRVTMEELTRRTLEEGLAPKVVPEFKGITVGGAIMGAAAESSSQRWGLFSDICRSYDLVYGDGTVNRLSVDSNPALFYGIAGSYGSFGILVRTEVELVEVKQFVHLKYHVFSHPLEAVHCINRLSHGTAAFLDGIIFSEKLSVVIEGHLRDDREGLPLYSQSPLSPWYYQHIEQRASQGDNYEEAISLYDYLFRYDQGAFWMGAYLFRPSFLVNFLMQGVLHLFRRPGFSAEEVASFHKIPSPATMGRLLFYPWLKSQKLWALLHRTESWVHERIVIQDFCIPTPSSTLFLEKIINDPCVFPIWLCPIKGTKHPQIFAPHVINTTDPFSHFLNFGIYGIPKIDEPIDQITKRLEQHTSQHKGRKVLYSRSYYSEDAFWKIYSQSSYENLRKETCAEGIWHGITEKVLSE